VDTREHPRTPADTRGHARTHAQSRYRVHLCTHLVVHQGIEELVCRGGAVNVYALHELQRVVREAVDHAQPQLVVHMV